MGQGPVFYLPSCHSSPVRSLVLPFRIQVGPRGHGSISLNSRKLAFIELVRLFWNYLSHKLKLLAFGGGVQEENRDGLLLVT